MAWAAYKENKGATFVVVLTTCSTSPPPPPPQETLPQLPIPPRNLLSKPLVFFLPNKWVKGGGGTITDSGPLVQLIRPNKSGRPGVRSSSPWEGSRYDSCIRLLLRPALGQASSHRNTRDDGRMRPGILARHVCQKFNCTLYSSGGLFSPLPSSGQESSCYLHARLRTSEVR